jgi:hypothetical protein
MTVVNIGKKRRRLCKDGIIEDYMRYAIYQESPPDFHLWVCLSLIASALGRNCWTSMGMWETYPCMYIILVGESAITHKSTAIKMGMRPFREALPELAALSQKMSPEALINTLAKLSDPDKGSGRAEAFMESSELSNLLGQSKMDDSLIKLLTELWDAPSHFSYATLQRGVETVKDVCLNLLGGSTPSWLRNSVPESALEGGFFSRLILVSRPPKGEKNSRPMMSPDQREAIENVKNDLICIRQNMQGEFTLDTAAQEFFDEWYHEHNHPQKANSFMRGYYGRKGDFMQKIAMCLSASFSDSMIITAEDMMMAHRLLNENEKYTEGLVKYMGTTEDGQKYVRVLNAIRRGTVSVPVDTSGLTKEQIQNESYPTVVKRGLEHSLLQQRLGHQVRKDDIQMAIDALIDANEITMLKVGQRGRRVYIINEENASIETGLD